MIYMPVLNVKNFMMIKDTFLLLRKLLIKTKISYKLIKLLARNFKASKENLKS